VADSVKTVESVTVVSGSTSVNAHRPTQNRRKDARSREIAVGAVVEKDRPMEFSHVLALVAGWAVVSVPASLLIGACMGRAEQLPGRLVKVR